MGAVAMGGKYAEATANISTEGAYLAPAAAPNQELQTVPGGETWELLGAAILATTTATVGNRTYRIRVRTAGGVVLYQTAVGANIAASQTNSQQNFLIGGTPALAANMFVAPGLVVEAFDAAAIDATNDVVNLHLMVRKHFHAQ